MFGIHFGSHTPAGSPLDPRLAARPAAGPVGALQSPVDPLAPLPETFAPTAAPATPGVTPPLPTPPASVTRKKLNPFDKEHISDTLAQISKGFFSSNSFLGGIGAAATNVVDRTNALEKEALGTTETGGPDSAFEIHTDQYGNKTYTPVKAVQDYVANKSKAEREAKNAPKPADSENWLGDTSYAIEQLPPPQRPGAYRLMLEQGKAMGYDVSQAPPEYSPTFSSAMINRTIGARQGSSNAATAANRDAIARDRAARLALTTRSTDARIANSNAAGARAERRLRAAPPSRGGGLPPGFIMDNH